ncbi:MAG: CRTAC1 family protein [Planctomycetes bacterium]|nr:CRTAC1 family protein [Planctomycetota bacterium]
MPSMPPHLPAAALLLACAGLARAQTFTDVSATCGVLNQTSHSPALCDFDGDGDLDLYLTTEPGNIFTPGFPRSNVLYENRSTGPGNVVFVDVTAAKNLVDRGAWSQDGRFADLNRDGIPDLYVSNLVIQGATPPNQLYLGSASGAFTEVASFAGATGGGNDNVGAVLDIDGDGLTDLYTGQNTRNFLLRCTGIDAQGRPSYSSFGDPLWQEPLRNTWSAAWCDFDRDGRRDVYLANRADTLGSDGRDALIRNLGGGNAALVLQGLNDVVLNGFAAWGDYDADGDPDLYVSNWQTYSGTAIAAPHGQLYRNDGAAGFTNVTSLLAGITAAQELSLAWGDIDNDGDLDLYVVTAEIFSAARLWVNQLRETGQPGFQERAAQAGIDDPRFLFGCAFGDLDRNGFLDLITTCEGDLFNDYFTGVYLNQGTNGNHWIAWKPIGTLSSTMAEGLRASLLTPDGHRQWFELGAMEGTYGQSAPELHFGLGANTAITELVLRWPSGVEQRVSSAAIDARHTLVETGLVVRGEVRRGRTVSLQVGGPAGDAAVTFASAGASSIPLPPFGTLGLDPLTLFQLDARVLPASRRGELAIPIPNDPSLAGARVYLQSLIGPLPALLFRNVVALQIL